MCLNRIFNDSKTSSRYIRSTRCSRIFTGDVCERVYVRVCVYNVPVNSCTGGRVYVRVRVHVSMCTVCVYGRVGVYT